MAGVDWYGLSWLVPVGCVSVWYGKAGDAWQGMVRSVMLGWVVAWIALIRQLRHGKLSSGMVG